jgi:tripartite-type tricarboxylate transporter receptor subunit TctC
LPPLGNACAKGTIRKIGRAWIASGPAMAREATVRTALVRAGLFAIAAAFGATHAAAQSADKYPERPIKIIVPYAPGGSTDIIARVLGQKMTENWNQQVIVETRPGAATVIGMTAAVTAPPDGYTLVINGSNLATSPALNDTLPYDALKDLAPISLLGHVPIVFYVNPKFPPRNLKEMAAYGKDKPIPFGSAGIASMTHLVAETFKAEQGIGLMQHVVYRGGGPALNDVLAGTIPVTSATITQALPQWQSGLVRALGVTATERHRSLSGVQTFREQGFDLVATEWYGLFTPTGTPKPIVLKLNAEMRRSLALDLGERVSAIDLAASSPEELGGFLKSEIERWSPVIKKLGLKM